MQICKGEKSYKCSEIKTFTTGETQVIKFAILEPVPHTEVVNLFDDNTFYFYDDVLNGRLIETNDKQLVGLSIIYNSDSTCNITIKLKKGVVGDES